MVYVQIVAGAYPTIVRIVRSVLIAIGEAKMDQNEYRSCLVEIAFALFIIGICCYGFFNGIH